MERQTVVFAEYCSTSKIGCGREIEFTKQNTPIIAERQIRLINASLSICNADFFKSLPIANSTEQTVNRNTLQVNMTATQKISPSTPYIAIINGCPIKITLL